MTENKDYKVPWASCFDCKYSSVQDGMQSCTWKSGRYSCLQKCERFERDWASKIIAEFGFLTVFIFPILLIVYLVLYSSGVLK